MKFTVVIIPTPPSTRLSLHAPKNRVKITSSIRALSTRVARVAPKKCAMAEESAEPEVRNRVCWAKLRSGKPVTTFF